MNNPQMAALEVEGVKSASFHKAGALWKGVVYDGHTGIEYDVRQLNNGKWNVNDDIGRNFAQASLVAAIEQARKENDVVGRLLPAFRPWYSFGWRSPVVLFKRLRSGHPVIFHPRFTAQMKWQRAQRGWSVEDTWGFNYHLARVIGGGVRHMRSIAHGYPDGLTFEEWKTVLDEIAEGMDAALVMLDEYDWPEGGEEKFNRAMDHLKKWFAALWD